MAQNWHRTGTKIGKKPVPKLCQLCQEVSADCHSPLHSTDPHHTGHACSSVSGALLGVRKCHFDTPQILYTHFSNPATTQDSLICFLIAFHYYRVQIPVFPPRTRSQAKTRNMSNLKSYSHAGFGVVKKW